MGIFRKLLKALRFIVSSLLTFLWISRPEHEDQEWLDDKQPENDEGVPNENCDIEDHDDDSCQYEDCPICLQDKIEERKCMTDTIKSVTKIFVLFIFIYLVGFGIVYMGLNILQQLGLIEMSE